MSFLEKYHYYLKDLESPNHYIDWNFYFSIAACLSRKVWWGDYTDFPVFGNLYLIFVGPPATGKSLPAVRTVEILRGIKYIRINPDTQKEETKDAINIAPDASSLEGMWRRMAEATTSFVLDPGPPKKVRSHTSMAFCCGEELGTLFRKNTDDLVMFLTAGYNCGNFVYAPKHDRTDSMNNMCVSLLGCCTMDWIKKNVSNELIGNGFTSRVIFIYGERPRQRTPQIKIDDDQRKAILEVREHWKLISQLVGEVKMTPDAKIWFDDWVINRQDKEHTNKHPCLDYYYGRKKIHLVKCAMLQHFGESTDMVLTLRDFEIALARLNYIELDMHKALNHAGEIRYPHLLKI